jgi:hypothetical protein
VLVAGGGDLFLVALPGKQVRRLTATAAAEELAAFSPDGRGSLSFAATTSSPSSRDRQRQRLTETGHRTV